MTPHFAGSEPVIAPSGKYKGTSVLQDEQYKALSFVNMLDNGQRAKAILSSEKTRNNNLTEAWKDNAVVPAGRHQRRRSRPARSAASCST